MLNEFAPRREKLSLREKIRISSDVRIATKAMTPTAMIKMVREARPLLALKLRKAICMFSIHNIACECKACKLYPVQYSINVNES